MLSRSVGRVRTFATLNATHLAAVALCLSILTPSLFGAGPLRRATRRQPVLKLHSAQTGQSVALAQSQLQVPASMRWAPFDVDRSLMVPSGFSASVYARIGDARFMAVAPNDDLLVSEPSAGKVVLVRSVAGGDPQVFDFVTGFKKPHDIVFHTIDATTYVYISESNQVNRFIYNSGDTFAHDREVVVSGLPDTSTPGLNGAYNHELKNIALDSNHKLYVSIGSTCNVCMGDTTSNPIRAAIYQYDADGTNPRLFARGLRNAEGVRFLPGTNELWVVVNGRDDIAYPLNDGTGQYGRVIPSFVDNHPPDQFTHVRNGGNYGWPFCNPDPDTAAGMDNPPFDRDFQLNPDGHVNCDAMDRVSKGIQAHSAPLGLLFLQDTAFSTALRDGAVVALHGSWDRQAKTGYKVAYFPWDTASQAPGAQSDLVSGWLDDGTGQVWGRPVDVAVSRQGDLYVSDDLSGTIYKLTSSVAQGAAPQIISVMVEGRNVIVSGQNFDSGAVILVDGQSVRTRHETDPNTLTGKKLLKFLTPGQPVNIQVQDSNGMLSPGVPFTAP
jgi:glucose/arabinose dehydrogenase